jgi:hypothetical protein
MCLRCSRLLSTTLHLSRFSNASIIFGLTSVTSPSTPQILAAQASHNSDSGADPPRNARRQSKSISSGGIAESMGGWTSLEYDACVAVQPSGLGYTYE